MLDSNVAMTYGKRTIIFFISLGNIKKEMPDERIASENEDETWWVLGWERKRWWVAEESTLSRKERKRRQEEREAPPRFPGPSLASSSSLFLLSTSVHPLLMERRRDPMILEYKSCRTRSCHEWKGLYKTDFQVLFSSRGSFKSKNDSTDTWNHLSHLLCSKSALLAYQPGFRGILCSCKILSSCDGDDDDAMW